MTYLLHKGLEPKMAFKIMEITRKGKAADPAHRGAYQQAMREHGVPDWYIESLYEDQVHVPEGTRGGLRYCGDPAGLVQGVTVPLEYYAAYFTIRGGDIDAEAAVRGLSTARLRMQELKKLGNERTTKEDVPVHRAADHV